MLSSVQAYTAVIFRTFTLQEPRANYQSINIGKIAPQAIYEVVFYSYELKYSPCVVEMTVWGGIWSCAYTCSLDHRVHHLSLQEMC